MNAKIKNYYEVLSVDASASANEIEAGYKRAKDKASHENAGPFLPSRDKEQRLKEITEAYDMLNDPISRKIYDTELKKEIEKRYQNARFTREPVVMGEEFEMIAEQYRILYANIEHAASKGRLKSIAVTSSVKGEGKSATSLNLAYMMANEFKKRTILVESDLRKPSTVSAYLDAPPAHGLSNVLKGEMDLASAILRIGDTRLYVIPSGNISGKTSEILEPSALKAIVGSLKSDFDYAIFDCPPILPLYDMNILSRHVDGIIIVVRAGKTPKDIVERAVDIVSKHNVIGMVLNGSDNKLKKYYY